MLPIPSKQFWSRLGALFVTAALCLVSVGAYALPLVVFSFDSLSAGVGSGTTSLQVDLLASQSDGADAAGITLGFATSGVITDVALQSFGAAVSVSDSSFGNLGGTIGLIAVAPSNPGSFGVDVDFVVATLTLTLNTALGGSGSLSLVDLSLVAGAPALAEDGLTEIPSDLSAAFAVTVPEPVSAVLLVLLPAGLALGSRRRS